MEKACDDESAAPALGSKVFEFEFEFSGGCSCTSTVPSVPPSVVPSVCVSGSAKQPNKAPSGDRGDRGSGGEGPVKAIDEDGAGVGMRSSAVLMAWVPALALMLASTLSLTDDPSIAL